MHRSRPSAAVLVGVLALAPLATACSSSGQEGSGGGTVTASPPVASPVPASSSPAPAAASAPADWPAAVPFYGEGTLKDSSVENDGTARALWIASGAATTALRKYGELLVASGFELVKDGTVDGIPTAEYSGNGYSVVVQAVGLEGDTSVSIAAAPA